MTDNAHNLTLGIMTCITVVLNLDHYLMTVHGSHGVFLGNEYIA